MSGDLVDFSGSLIGSAEVEKASSVAWDYYRAKAYHLYRHSPLARGLVRTLGDSVVGEGIKIKASPIAKILGLSEKKARNWAEETQARFSVWSDMSGWADTQYIAYMTYRALGDCPVMLTTSGARLKPIPMDNWVIDPNKNGQGWVAGVLEGKNKRVKKIALRSGYNSPPRVLSSYDRAGRRVFVLLRRRDLGGEVRGTPEIADLYEIMKNVSLFLSSTVKASRIKSAILGSVYTHDTGSTAGSFVSNNLLSKSGNSDFRLGAEGEHVLTRLGENERIDIFNTDRDVPGLEEYITSVATIAGANFGLPASFFLKKFTGSYSSSRAETIEAQKAIRRERLVFLTEFLAPVYKEWLRREVQAGRISCPGWGEEERRAAWSHVVARGARQESVQPLQDAKTFQVLVDMGVISVKQVAELYGYDHTETEHEEKRKDEE